MGLDIIEALQKTTKSIVDWSNKKLNNKVDKVSGKQLTDQNYSLDEKNKVANMATGLMVIDDVLFLKTDSGYMSETGIDLSQYGGGGGGGTSSSKVTVENLMSSNEITVASGTEVKLKFNYQSENSTIGTAMIYIDDVVKGTKSITSKEDGNEIDVSEYLKSGYNKLTLICIDSYGHQAQLIYIINVVSLSLTTSFNDAKSYTGTYFEVPYVLTADGDKMMHFEFDSEDTTEIISSSGSNLKKRIYFGSRSHGVYTLKVYAEMEVSGQIITSDIYNFEVMYAIGTTPLISSVCNIKIAKQYETVNIPFAVYHSTNTSPVVDLIISQNGEVYSQKTMTANRDERMVWSARTALTGDVTFTISYEGVSKSHIITVAESDLSVSVRQDDLAFELKADGKSNNDTDKNVWYSDTGDVSVSFENVGWNVTQKTFIISGADSGKEIKKQYAIGTGWVTDDNGRTALRLSGDARATVGFKPFAEDWTEAGKTIEMEFAIRDVNNRDAVVISCMNNNVGFKVTADTASLIRNNTPLVECKYVDDEKIHLAFVVERQVMNDHVVRLVTSYLNGVLSGAATFADNDTIFQNPAVNISIGSSDCSIDLYMMRFYDVALTNNELRDNYIADCMDPNLMSDNDIYANGAIEYSKLENKIPIMRITGELPSKKADSNKKKGGRDYPVNIIYTNMNSVPVIKDSALIHVQGTSSEGYIRKNWDLDFETEYQPMENQLGTDYFTMKADYAEATGTHNTANANYVHTFYSGDKFKNKPPFDINPLTRSTIAGFPCVIFHRKTENDPYVFSGKYNFNFSKNSENIFGFTAVDDNGNPVYPKIQSWEFCENKYLACRFRQDPDASDITDDDWKEWFDDRYLYDGGDMEDFKKMYRWVYSTCQDNATDELLTDESSGESKPYVDIDGVTHTYDTKAYRLAKFKTEFEDHFDMDFSLVYYLYTFIMLMCDQRAKNQFLTSWDGKIWFPWLYDNDTCLGINNEGYLRYDYYHEDLGQNDVVGQTHIYNGYDSVLWNNFSEAFADKIQQTYSSWRSGDTPLLSYDNVIKYFITNQSDKWSISIYNEDAEYKYISLYRNNDNPEFLYQVKGTGEEHLKYFIKNRLMYCDSKWQSGDFVNKDTNTILMRLNSPDGIEDEEIQPDMTIRFKTFSNMYTGVRYGTNGVLNSKYTDRGKLVEITMPEGEDPNNLDTYIFGANEISEFADLSLLYPNLLNLSAASKLTKAIIGNSHPNYKNDVLKNLSFSNNRLLKEVNICNCTGLTSIIDFSLCPDIQYIYATGSNISGVQLPESGFLKILHLPRTISNITLVNQHHIDEFMCEGYDNITTIRIENSENVPMQDVLLGCNSSVLASVSIKNIDWNVDSEENLRIIIDKLVACKGSVVEGSVYLPSGTTVSDDLKVIIHQNFPNLNVIDDNPVFYIDYYNYDNTIWDTEMVQAGNNAIGPSKGNPDDIIQELQGLRHLFVKWKILPINVNKNYQIDATWQTQHAIKFHNYDGELIDTLWYDYGKAAEDPVSTGAISTPTKEGDSATSYKFSGWDNLPTNVQSTTSVYAQYDTYWAARFWNESKLHVTEWILDGTKAIEPEDYFEDYTVPTKTSTAQYDYTFNSWSGDFDSVLTESRDFYATYSSTIRRYNVYFYNDTELLYTVENIPYGGSTKYIGSTPTKLGVDNPDEYVFKGWMPLPENITGETYCYALFKFTGYLFGKLGKTDSEDYGYGTVDNPNWDAINGYWDVIASDVKAYKSGTLSVDDFAMKYPIGGRMLVPINLSTGMAAADIEIIDYEHDNLSDGSGKAALTFFCVDLPSVTHNMNNNGTNEGGWKDSDMRNFVNNELFSALPSELQSVIQPVDKLSDGGTSNMTLVSTSDKCWLASYDEVGFSFNSSVVSGQGESYSTIFTSSDNSRKKYVFNTTTIDRWWLRSSCSSGISDKGRFCRVTNAGGNYGDIASNPYYVAFGFCI